MAEHNDLGKQGEELARAYLAEKGYEILETNWPCGKTEIDIIAIYNACLVIVEVKTRSSRTFGEPEDFVTLNKQRILINASQVYVEMKGISNEVRFDIVSIIIRGDRPEVLHIEDAFYPVL